ncbi:hypothetical protein BD626DRAFT_480296 [Schizophyllum amplum]|uniref:Uncharacterized protein n=1 Tax=Schizophyllum amplum TaxID=97359 RepID=A0A550CT31_9AGAR|nr:hypothetical protein BD626DRAFT_480296 [Auriculariopsis ampla]
MLQDLVNVVHELQPGRRIPKTLGRLPKSVQRYRWNPYASKRTRNILKPYLPLTPKEEDLMSIAPQVGDYADLSVFHLQRPHLNIFPNALLYFVPQVGSPFAERDLIDLVLFFCENIALFVPMGLKILIIARTTDGAALQRWMNGIVYQSMREFIDSHDLHSHDSLLAMTLEATLPFVFESKADSQRSLGLRFGLGRFQDRSHVHGEEVKRARKTLKQERSIVGGQHLPGSAEDDVHGACFVTDDGLVRDIQRCEGNAAQRCDWNRGFSRLIS